MVLQSFILCHIIIGIQTGFVSAGEGQVISVSVSRDDNPAWVPHVCVLHLQPLQHISPKRLLL